MKETTEDLNPLDLTRKDINDMQDLIYGENQFSLIMNSIFAIASTSSITKIELDSIPLHNVKEELKNRGFIVIDTDSGVIIKW